MRKLTVFNSVSVDGYFCTADGEMSVFHQDDPEWNEFVSGNAGGNGTLLFGRITYQMMASFWPTPMAAQMMPEVAAGMNRMPKYVFSRSLDHVDWENTTLLKGDLIEEVGKLKQQDGPDIVILGSGDVVAQLAEAGLIDEFQVVVNPVALGAGRTMFEGVDSPIALRLIHSRTFANGNVVLCYQPAK